MILTGKIIYWANIICMFFLLSLAISEVVNAEFMWAVVHLLIALTNMFCAFQTRSNLRDIGA